MAKWKNHPRPGGNGCQYGQKSFSVPVGLHHIPDEEWDAIFGDKTDAEDDVPEPEGAERPERNDSGGDEVVGESSAG